MKYWEDFKLGERAELGRHTFSEQEIVESILAIGFYMTMARLTEATDVDLDPAAGMTVFEGGKKRSG